MSKILCSHVDLDGVGSVVLAEYFKEILQFDNILILDYGFEDDLDLLSYIASYDEIIFVDLTLPQEVVQNWIRGGSFVQIYDHHEETSWITSFNNSKWDKDRCGTKIFWEEFVKPLISRYPPIIDTFVSLVDTYDQWKENFEDWEEAKKLNSVFYGIKSYYQKVPYKQIFPFIQMMMKKFDKLSEWRWTRKEVNIIDRADKREKQMYINLKNDLSIRIDSKGRVFGVGSIPSKFSVVASHILDEQKELDYIININSYQGISGKLSFRSKRGFDCTKISVVNGHKAAAGGNIGAEDALYFLKNEYLSFKYNEDFEKDSSSIFSEQK